MQHFANHDITERTKQVGDKAYGTRSSMILVGRHLGSELVDTRACEVYDECARNSCVVH
jgi:hypothetical protein